MINLIDFKTRFDYEKNSEVSERMFVVYCSKTDEVLDINASKNIIWIDQSIKWMYKKLVFLSTTYCYSKKTLMIILSFQKQTP